MSFPRKKLVRDRVASQGTWDRNVEFVTADPKEYPELLADKLVEEATEVCQDMKKKNRDGVVEELADLATVTAQVMVFYSITPEELKVVVDKKSAERGTFAGHTVLIEHEPRR